MLAVKDKEILLEVKDICDKIIAKVTQYSHDEFVTDESVREFVRTNYLQVGKLVIGLSEEFLSTYKKIPWRHIKVMHNKVVGGFGDIDIEIIFRSTTQRIPELRDYCEEILSK